jgi:hypothetical protein
MQEKDEQLVYVPRTHPNTYPRKFIQNTLKIHRYLHNPTKRNFISMSCSRKDRMTGNQLYEANHLYSMNSNNYREICKKTATSKHHSKVKTTPHIKTQRKFRITPLDGAHYAKILPILKQTTRKNNAKYNGRINIRHTLSA